MRYEIEGQILTDIADSIRGKTGKSALIKAEDMAAAIREISGYPEPEGTVTISQNGTANVKDYASAAVNVQPNLQQKTATQNGTVTPDAGYDGLNSVIVDVPASDDPFVGLTNYIESSGTQYINTGYIPNDNTQVEVYFCAPSGVPANNELLLFGSRNMPEHTTSAYNAAPFYISSQYGNAQILNLSWTVFAIIARKTYGSNLSAESMVTGSGKPYFLYSFTGKKQYIKTGIDEFSIRSEDGNRISLTNLTPEAALNSVQPLYIFGLNDSGSAIPSTTTIRLYAFRIKENDQMIHEFVPAKDEHDVVCLRDTVSGEYFYNAGTGAFIFGTDE